MNIIMKLNWLNRERRQKRQALEIAGREQVVHWYRGVDVLVKKRVWHRSGPYIEIDSSLYLHRSKLIVHLIQSIHKMSQKESVLDGIRRFYILKGEEKWRINKNIANKIDCFEDNRRKWDAIYSRLSKIMRTMYMIESIIITEGQIGNEFEQINMNIYKWWLATKNTGICVILKGFVQIR